MASTKIAIEREQRQACLSYAERKQFGQSQRRGKAVRGAVPRLSDAFLVKTHITTDLKVRGYS